MPSSAAIVRGLVPSIAPPSPKEVRRKQKKEKEGAQDAEKENSLGTLTRRFLEMAAMFPGGVLELNDIAIQLGVSKRRMYDITNVLEGINLVEKQSKNVILWKAGTPLTEDQKTKIGIMRREVDKIHQLEKKLDASITAVQLAIDHYTTLPTCYVHHSDVRGVPYLSGKMILAVKAAKGAEVEIDRVPGVHRMTLRSETEIDVYVLTTEENGANEAAPTSRDESSSPRLDAPTVASDLSTPGRKGVGHMATDAMSTTAAAGATATASTSRQSDLASLVEMANTASNQAPVPVTKRSPNSLLTPPVSPISPTRSDAAFGVIPLGAEDFGFNSPLFPSPPRSSPVHTRLPMHASIPLGLASPPGLNLIYGSADESALPGMLNEKASSSTPAASAGAAAGGASNNLGAALPSRTSAANGSTPSNGIHLTPYKTDLSSDISPFKPTRRSSNWGSVSTPEVSSSGFDDFVEATTSPSKPGFALSPTSSPEKRPFPLGGGFGTDQLESQDGFSFFPESSIGLPSHSHRG
jgi:hypothetical protein